MAEKVTISDLRRMLIGLSDFGIAMSELEKLSDHQDLLSTDYFTVSRRSPTNTFTGQDHKNVNLKYSSISAKFLERFKTDDITANGNWTFGLVTTSNIRCKTSTLKPWVKTDPEVANMDNYGVVTIKYYNDNFSRMVRDLSSMYYDCRSVNPPYRFASNEGDIITTNSKAKNSMNDYSFPWENNRWQRIENEGPTQVYGTGVMILGMGSCEENNYTKFGECKAGGTGTGNVDSCAGTYTSIIDIAHFPNHTHKFTADTVNFNMVFRIRGTVCKLAGKPESMATASQFKWNHVGIGHIAGACHASTTTLTPLKMTGSTSLTSKQWEGVLTVANTVCNPTTGHEIADVDEYSAHNNVPPIIFLYLNQREGSRPVR